MRILFIFWTILLVQLMVININARELVFQKVYPDKTFDRPIGYLNLDGDIYVLEQKGKLCFCQGAKKSIAIDLSKRHGNGNEEGFLSLIPCPEFKKNKKLYAYYSAQNPRRSIVSRFELQNKKLVKEEVILEIDEPYWNHNGGGMAFGPDKMLYIAVGDGGSGGDPKEKQL